MFIPDPVPPGHQVISGPKLIKELLGDPRKPRRMGKTALYTRFQRDSNFLRKRYKFPINLYESNIKTGLQ